MRVPPHPVGDAHFRWKADAVSYTGLHHWVRWHKGAPKKCEHCGATDRPLQWANVSHEYQRDLDDFIGLCVPCHRKYDLGPRIAAQAAEIQRVVAEAQIHPTYQRRGSECLMDECSSPVLARGLCGRHYKRARKAS